MTNQVIAQGYIDSNMVITQGYSIGVPPPPIPVPDGGGQAQKKRRIAPKEPSEFWLIVKSYLEMKQQNA